MKAKKRHSTQDGASFEQEKTRATTRSNEKKVKSSTEVDEATKALVAELGKTKKEKKVAKAAQKEQGENQSKKQKDRKVGKTSTKATKAKGSAVNVVLPVVIQKKLNEAEQVQKKETKAMAKLKVSKPEDRQKVRDIIKQVRRRRLALNVLVEKELARLSSSPKKDSKKIKKATSHSNSPSNKSRSFT